MEFSDLPLSSGAVEPEDPVYSEEVILGDGLEILNEVGDSEEENNEEEVDGDYQDYEETEDTAANPEYEYDEDMKDNTLESGEYLSDTEDLAVESDPFRHDNSEDDFAAEQESDQDEDIGDGGGEYDKKPHSEWHSHSTHFKFDLNWEIDDDPEIFCLPKSECMQFKINQRSLIGLRLLSVQNLPVDTTTKDVAELFNRFGRVATIKRRTFEGKPFRSYEEVQNDPCFSAFVLFKDSETITKIIESLGHTTTFKDHVILLKRVRSETRLANNSVVVTNLSPDTTKEDLQHHFRQFGETMSVRLKYGVGYIAWSKVSAKTMAVKSLDQSELKGHKINVYEMKPRFDAFTQKPFPTKNTWVNSHLVNVTQRDELSECKINYDKMGPGLVTTGKKHVPVNNKYNPHRMQWINPNLRTVTNMGESNEGRIFQPHQIGDTPFTHDSAAQFMPKKLTASSTLGDIEVNEDFEDNDFKDKSVVDQLSEDDEDMEDKRVPSQNKSDPEDAAVESTTFRYGLNWELDDDPEIVCLPSPECFHPKYQHIATKMLFVQNLPVDTNKKDLLQFFKPFGRIVIITLRTFEGKMPFLGGQNGPCVTASVTFGNPDSVPDVFARLGHTTTFKGHVILLKKVKSENSFANNSVMVTNLPPDTTKEDLQNHFRPFGEARSVRLKQGVGYLAFGRSAIKKRARQSLDQSELKGYKINVYAIRPGIDPGEKPVKNKYNNFPNQMQWINPNIVNATYVGGSNEGRIFQPHPRADTSLSSETVVKLDHLDSQIKSGAEDAAMESVSLKYDLNWELDDDPEIVCLPSSECVDPKHNIYSGSNLVFVQNLPVDTKIKEIMQFFKPFGRIAIITLRTFEGKPLESISATQNGPCASASVLFKNLSSVTEVYKRFGHSTTFKDHVILLKKVRSKSRLANISVVVTNLSPDTTKEDLQNHFKDIGDLLSVRLKHGVGYVAFKKSTFKNLARQILDQSELKGCKINVHDMRPERDLGEKTVNKKCNPNKMQWINPNLSKAMPMGASNESNMIQFQQRGDSTFSNETAVQFMPKKMVQSQGKKMEKWATPASSAQVFAPYSQPAVHTGPMVRSQGKQMKKFAPVSGSTVHPMESVWNQGQQCMAWPMTANPYVDNGMGVSSGSAMFQYHQRADITFTNETAVQFMPNKMVQSRGKKLKQWATPAQALMPFRQTAVHGIPNNMVQNRSKQFGTWAMPANTNSAGVGSPATFVQTAMQKKIKKWAQNQKRILRKNLAATTNTTTLQAGWNNHQFSANTFPHAFSPQPVGLVSQDFTQDFTPD